MNSIVPILALDFASPWLLWGLALGGIPVLIHLLYRRAYRQTDWAAMRFLIEAARRNSRRMRLEQWILLAVRTLALLLMALAFAQPRLRAVSSGTRTRVPVHRVVILDASFSMGALRDRETRFVHAQKLAREIVMRALPGDAVNVLRIAERTTPIVVREPAYDHEAVLAEIDRLKVSDEPGDLRPTLLATEEILADARAPQTKEIVILSDFQRLTWEGDPSSRSQNSALLEKLAQRGTVTLFDVGDGRTDNVAVTALQTVEPIVLADRASRIRASVRNFGGSSVPGCRVELLVDGYPAGDRTVELHGGEETVVEFRPEFRGAGEHAVECRLPADRLAADNQRWLSVPVSQRVRVLVVNGRDGGRPSDRASHYIRTVLAPSTSREMWNGATDPKVISESDLSAQNLSRFDCVILCNVPLVTPTEANLLEAYIKNGGGVIITLGDRVQPENYNAVLWRDGQGLLPVSLGERIGGRGEKARGDRFDAGELSHSILAPFRGNPGAGLGRVVTFEHVQVKVPSNSSAQIALRFESGDPAIVERAMGQGRCVLVTTSADLSWSAWPVHPTFPPLVQEMVRFAAQGRWHERQRLVGDPLPCADVRRILGGPSAGEPVNEGTLSSAATVIVKSPQGMEHVVSPAASMGGMVSEQGESAFTDTLTRGLYEMSVRSKGLAGVARRELYAVNVDTRESDLTPVDEKTLLGSLFGGLPGVSFVRRSQWSESPRDWQEGPALASPISSWLMFAALGLLLVEPLMAWSFRRGAILLVTFSAVAVLFFAVPGGTWRLVIIGIALFFGIVAILWYGEGIAVPGSTDGFPASHKGLKSWRTHFRFRRAPTKAADSSGKSL